MTPPKPVDNWPTTPPQMDLVTYVKKAVCGGVAEVGGFGAHKSVSQGCDQGKQCVSRYSPAASWAASFWYLNDAAPRL